MDKVGFSSLFDRALERAATRAEQRIGRSISRTFLIEFYLRTHQGSLIRPSEAVDALYLGPELFYKTIDMAVRSARSEATIVFVRPSGHAPVPFFGTFDPKMDGPFKQIDAGNIEVDKT